MPDTQRAWPAWAGSNAKPSMNWRTGAVIDKGKPSAMPGLKKFDISGSLDLAVGQLESLCKAPYLQRLLFVDISILRHAELAAFENCRAMGMSAAMSGSQFERHMRCRWMVTLGSERVLNWRVEQPPFMTNIATDSILRLKFKQNQIGQHRHQSPQVANYNCRHRLGGKLSWLT